MFVALTRIIKSGFQIFHRNLALFAVTIVVMAMMLFVFAGLFTFRFLAERAVTEAQERIALSVFFDATADESEILRARDLLAQLPEVERVEFVSREEALARFRERHVGNVALMRALEEVGVNPLQASLNIRAREVAQYASIATFLDTAPFRNQVTRVTFAENQHVIERLNRLIVAARNIGLALSVVLMSIAVLVFFSTMRIAIYTFREEIAIMKLVGASNHFTRGPFAVAGIIAGAIAALVSFALFVLLLNITAPRLEVLLPGVGMAEFFSNTWLFVLATQLALGVILGMVTSSFATNKYLKV